MKELKEYKLGDVVNILDSRRVPLSSSQRRKRQGKYPYYGAQGIIDYIDDYIFDGEYLLIAEDGENLKSKKQNIGIIAKGKYWVNNHAHILETNELCNLRYLYYLINKIDVSGYITGSAQPKLSQSNLKLISLTLPSKEYQDLIVNILKPLDDKIQINNKINENLEQQAQALFKSWFVDFEPFKNGRFVDSELGMIPEGWEIGNLLDVANIYDSKRKPLSSRQRSQMKKIYPYYGATSIMDYVDDYIFDGIYLLMGEDGSVADENGYPFLQYVNGKFWPNNHAHVMQGKTSYSTEMLYCFLKKKNITAYVTGAVQAKLSQSNMKKILLPIPPSEISRKILPLFDVIFKEIRNIESEIKCLTELHDALLPKLMSGEINVDDID